MEGQGRKGKGGKWRERREGGKRRRGKRA